MGMRNNQARGPGQGWRRTLGAVHINIHRAPFWSRRFAHRLGHHLVFNWWAVGSLRLQPLLVVVVSAGFRLPFLPGAALVFFLGYLSDIFSGGVVGLQVAVYMMIFVVCALAQLKLEINSWPFQMAAVGVMSLFVPGAFGGRPHLGAPKLSLPAQSGPGRGPGPFERP